MFSDPVYGPVDDDGWSVKGLIGQRKLACTVLIDGKERMVGESGHGKRWLVYLTEVRTERKQLTRLRCIDQGKSKVSTKKGQCR